MLAHIFFITLFAGAFAQENSYEDYSDFEILKNLTEAGKKRVLQILAEVDNAPKFYDSYTEERLGSLIWECTVQEQNLNKSLTEAVLIGILKNKQFTNFQCISNNSQKTINELNQIKTQILANSQQVKENKLGQVRQFKLILPAFFKYVEDLYQKKNEEMKKAGKETSRKKILEEVLVKMKLLDTVTEQISDKILATKYKFIEEYSNFASNMETSLRSIQKKGAQNILNCVA